MVRAVLVGHSVDLAAGGRFALDIDVATHVVVRLQVDVEAPFTTTRFPLGNNLVWENASAETWVGAGLDAHFP